MSGRDTEPETVMRFRTFRVLDSIDWIHNEKAEDRLPRLALGCVTWLLLVLVTHLTAMVAFDWLTGRVGFTVALATAAAPFVVFFLLVIAGMTIGLVRDEMGRAREVGDQ